MAAWRDDAFAERRAVAFRDEHRISTSKSCCSNPSKKTRVIGSGIVWSQGIAGTVLERIRGNRVSETRERRLEAEVVTNAATVEQRVERRTAFGRRRQVTACRDR